MPALDPFARTEELIRRVYAYVAYRIGPGADAEDVTSETFARALRYRASFSASKGDPTAWLIGIARRCVATHYAEQAPAADDLADAAAPDDLEERTAQRVDLAAAVAVLADRDRELIALRYGADLTARQIASLLDMRLNAVEVALHRALGRVREELGRRDAPKTAEAGTRPASAPPSY
jgi:RNA polymerase sigma factor (sigma-70 family)